MSNSADCKLLCTDIGTEKAARNFIGVNLLMTNQFRLNRKGRQAIGPRARVKISASSFVRRVELGQVFLETGRGVGDKGAIVVRTWIIAPIVNSAAMLEKAIAAEFRVFFGNLLKLY